MKLRIVDAHDCRAEVSFPLQPLARPPRLLLDEHGAELLEPGGRIREHREDLLTLRDRQREDLDLVLDGSLQLRAGGPVDAAGELATSSGGTGCRRASS